MAVEPSKEDLQRFGATDDGAPFVLVQLLRLADGGLERYLQYAAGAQPILNRLGAQLLYGGQAGPPLIAAQGQAWDAIVLVRYPNRSAYLKFLADPAYLAIAHLRHEAVREAVYLPMNDWAAR